MTDFEVLKLQMEANREFFFTGKRITVRERKLGLRRLRAELAAQQPKILSALYDDLGKSETEARMSELIPLFGALDFLRRRVGRYSRPKLTSVSVFNFPALGMLVPEPYGQALVISTWNYPLLMALEPAIAAYAAGNRVILKQSPLSPNTAQIVSEIITKVFPYGEITVAGRNVDFHNQLLAEPFDYIFFTGSRQAGAEVMRRAAEHLTPVTLELGGKSPCIVDETADVKAAARRIVWGKFLNAGQTCVAPDYLMAHRSIKSELLYEMSRCIREFYGEHPLENPDWPKIVNDAHFKRLENLLAGGRLAAGGEKDAASLRIAPTIVDQVTVDDPVMAEEVFGPILPVLEYELLEEVIGFVNSRPKPLALYFFGDWLKSREVTRRTSSGGVGVNETVMHLTNSSMPFGGVGASGMGAYHGKYSFDTFTHYKPVMFKFKRLEAPLRYPPFAAWQRALVKFFCK